MLCSKVVGATVDHTHAPHQPYADPTGALFSARSTTNYKSKWRYTGFKMWFSPSNCGAGGLNYYIKATVAPNCRIKTSGFGAGGSQPKHISNPDALI